MNPHSGPFSIPAINNIIPEKVKPWIIILFVIIIQFSGAGIYMATAAEMVGGTSLMREDIMMAGFASLSGMTLVFAYMLRFKMRFTSKFSFLASLTVMVVANIICVNTTNVAVLVVTSFIAGAFRMLATFECNSTIQTWLTPKRDLTIFFCFIGLLIQSSILMGSSMHLVIAHIANWQYVPWFMIGGLLSIMLFVIVFFNNNRFMPTFPLFGIDWFGGLMWGISLLLANFIFIYGEHYDWFYATEIQTAALFLVIVLALNIYRASFIRHPFIPLHVFKFKPLLLTIALFFVAELFISPGHLIEHIYMEKILGYDAHHVATMSFYGWAGVICAAIFAYFYFAKNKNSYKSTFMIGFTAIVLHLSIMYFIIDYTTVKNAIGLPIFLRCFGYTIIEIVLLSNLLKIPFPSFFQALSVQAFMSVALGGSLGGAILHRIFNVVTTKNFQLMSAGMDSVNQELFKTHPGKLAYMLQGQVLMVSFKEIYGLLLMGSIICSIIFICYKYPYLPKTNPFPKWSTFRKVMAKN